jgi:aspartyl aminopeptidase
MAKTAANKSEKEAENVKELKNKLFTQKVNLGKTENLSETDKFCGGYKKFLDDAKTERLAVKAAVKILTANGFTEFNPAKNYSAGDKVYLVNRKRALIAAVIGKESIEKGVSILASHIDSPRIDLKSVPLYEDGDLAFFKTHYYGGIKKYQWTAIPLSLHGVIIRADGKEVEVSIGEKADEPVFMVNDLLPHLSEEQYKRPANKIIKGEELNVIVGSRPFITETETEKDLIKLNILSILNGKYGITENDFVSAELECVPAFSARDIGFDRSLIGAYGQDDRVCAYTSLMAVTDLKTVPRRTALLVLADKEEVGSDGNTGLNSAFMEHFIAELALAEKIPLHRVLQNSRCISADVGAGFDPTFPDVLEKKNAARMNYGVILTKFTGHGGKAGTSDASAEFVSEIRTVFDKNNIVFQTAELGKVDLGGGGTVAKYIANLNIDVIDAGVPVLSMHAPFEITAKCDVFMAYKGFSAFVSQE